MAHDLYGEPMAADDEFTIFLVLGLPGPWPPAAKVRLIDSTHQGGRQLTVDGYPDGHLEAAVATPPNTPPSSTMHFQRVGVTGPNLFVLTLTHGSGRLQAWINGTELLSLAASSGAVFAIPEREPEAPQPSYLHPDALATCEAAISNRADRFDTRRSFQPRVPSRNKTLDQQVEELRHAVQALQDLHRAASGGARHLVPAVASQLRGLVYWPSRNKDTPTWNPLLLRLANAAGAALPVFALLEHSSDVPDIVKVADFHAKNFVPSCLRRYPGDALMDLEEYLAVPVLRVRSAAGIDREASVVDILTATANSMGSAHYDETVPLYFDDFDTQVFLGQTLVHVLILGLAEVVAELGQHVLRQGVGT